MRRLQADKARLILDRVADELLPPDRREGMGAGGRGGSAGQQSILDPDGLLYDICGVSVCGGPDITGP